MSDTPSIQIKRIYEPPEDQDGFRVLVDRLWPRGVKKADVHIDLWAKEVAPTTELRKWFDHDPAKFDEFRGRYTKELQANREETVNVLEKANGAPITLLYAARDPACNHAAVLRSFLLAHSVGSQPTPGQIPAADRSTEEASLLAREFLRP